MKKNNKKIRTISKMKNAICIKDNDFNNKLKKNIVIIEYEDSTYNILDFKNNLDITKDYTIAFDENTKLKTIFKLS